MQQIGVMRRGTGNVNKARLQGEEMDLKAVELANQRRGQDLDVGLGLAQLAANKPAAPVATEQLGARNADGTANAWGYDKSTGKMGYTPSNFDSAKSDAAMYANGLPSAGATAPPTPTVGSTPAESASPVTPGGLPPLVPGLKGGGPVPGPGGIDRVPASGPQGEPVRLSKGEYILPVAVVEAMGGVEALDAMVESITGEKPTPGGEPMPPLPEQMAGLDGLMPKETRGFGAGGFVERFRNRGEKIDSAVDAASGSQTRPVEKIDAAPAAPPSEPSGFDRKAFMRDLYAEPARGYAGGGSPWQPPPNGLRLLPPAVLGNRKGDLARLQQQSDNATRAVKTANNAKGAEIAAKESTRMPGGKPPPSNKMPTVYKPPGALGPVRPGGPVAQYIPRGTLAPYSPPGSMVPYSPPGGLQTTFASGPYSEAKPRITSKEALGNQWNKASAKHAFEYGSAGQQQAEARQAAQFRYASQNAAKQGARSGLGRAVSALTGTAATGVGLAVTPNDNIASQDLEMQHMQQIQNMPKDASGMPVGDLPKANGGRGVQVPKENFEVRKPGGLDALTGNPADSPDAMQAAATQQWNSEKVTGPGDNIRATGITSKNRQGGIDQIYKNDLSNDPKGQAEFGKAIYSDSFRGATKKGANEDLNQFGQGVDGATFQEGKTGLNFGDVNAKQLAMMTQSGREALPAQLGLQQLEALKAWQGQPQISGMKTDRSAAGAPGHQPYLSFTSKAPLPDWGRDALGQPRAGESQGDMEYRKAAPAMAAQQHRQALDLEAVKGEAKNAGKPQQGMTQAHKNLFAAHMAGSGDRPPNPYAYNAAVSVFNTLSSLGIDPLTSEAQAHQYAARLDDTYLDAQTKALYPKADQAAIESHRAKARANELQRIQLELMEMAQPSKQAAG